MATYNANRDTVHYARQHLKLTEDTFAMVFYQEILSDLKNHQQFDILNEDFDIRTKAIRDDLDDFIDNELHYEFLSYFYSREEVEADSLSTYSKLPFELDVELGVLERAGETQFHRTHRKERLLNSIAEKVSTLMEPGLSLLNQIIW